jgi:hypothetical protein
LAPLIISVFLLAAFFFWEARLPEDMVAMYVFHGYRNSDHSTHGILQSSESLAGQKLHGACRRICNYALLVVRGCSALVLVGLAKCLWVVSHRYRGPFVGHSIIILDYFIHL